MDNSFQYNHMQQNVHCHILQFLLAHFYLLILLTDEPSKCKKELHPVNHQLLWVLLQTWLTEMLWDNTFEEVTEALWIASIKDLEQQIKAEYSKLEHILEFVNHPATGQCK